MLALSGYNLKTSLVTTILLLNCKKHVKTQQFAKFERIRCWGVQLAWAVLETVVSHLQCKATDILPYGTIS